MNSSIAQIESKINSTSIEAIISVKGILTDIESFIQINSKGTERSEFPATRKQILALEASLEAQGWRVNPSLYDKGFRAHPGQQEIPFDGQTLQDAIVPEIEQRSIIDRPMGKFAIIEALEGRFINTQRNGYKKVEGGRFWSFYGSVSLCGHSVAQLERWLETTKEAV